MTYKIKKVRIGMLRQWLNERVSNELITNEEILTMLGIKK